MQRWTVVDALGLCYIQVHVHSKSINIGLQLSLEKCGIVITGTRDYPSMSTLAGLPVENSVKCRGGVVEFLAALVTRA